MQALVRKFVSSMGALALTGGLMVAGTVTASAATNSVCSGGTIAAGTVRTLTIAGACELNGGNVTVKQDVVVRPGATLNGLFSGSTLAVGHTVFIGAGAVVFLGCDPSDSPCINDATATQGDSIGGDIEASRAAAVVIHDNVIGGSAEVIGGGSGFGCAPLFPGGPPDFTTFSSDTIGGSVIVRHLRTCWDGINGNTIAGSLMWQDNQGSPLTGDANLVDSNSIGGNLVCFADNPKPHLSDFAPTPNTVAGAAIGQCKGLV